MFVFSSEKPPASSNNDASIHFEELKYTVQTIRIATNPFEEYLCSPNEAMNMKEVSSRLSEFDSLLNKYDICRA